MLTNKNWMLFLALLTTSIPAFADSGNLDRTLPNVKKEQAMQAQFHMRPADTIEKSAKLTANAYRAYPPSCLADPLPESTSGPTYSKSVDLAALDFSTATYVRETVTITLWRIACSSSNSPTSYNAATLMRIQRSAANEGSATLYPLFPGVRVSQGSIAFDDAEGEDYIRVAAEPNTVISTLAAETPLVHSTTFVLENYPFETSGYFDFDSAFNIRFDNFFTSGTSQYTISVPAYAPTAATYPDAFEGLIISGYMSSNYNDPEHSGEGIEVQVFDLSGEDILFTFTWFTFDNLGIPYWIFGSAAVDRTSHDATVASTYFLSDGGFAGAFGSTATYNEWGTVSFSFPDCNTMNFTYNSAADFSSIPSGSGSRTWSRIANVNGLTCE